MITVSNVVTTQELWASDITEEQVTSMFTYREEQANIGKLIGRHYGTAISTTTPPAIDGNVVLRPANVTITWDSVESAQEYLDFIGTLNPVSATIVS